MHDDFAAAFLVEEVANRFNAMIPRDHHDVRGRVYALYAKPMLTERAKQNSNVAADIHDKSIWR
jgi:hypothetical protein